MSPCENDGTSGRHRRPYAHCSPSAGRSGVVLSLNDLRAGRDTLRSTSSIYFVTGLHRSGTTILSEAIAQAVEGSMVSVSDLAEHLPHLQDLVSKMENTGPAFGEKGRSREITPSTSVEYGWYLYSIGRTRSFRFKPAFRNQLADLIAAVKRRAGSERIVLKNPWDTGNEATLLLEFGDASSIIIRRSLQAIEASALQIIGSGFADETEMGSDPERFYESEDYLQALMNDDPLFQALSKMLRRPSLQRLLALLSKWNTRIGVLILVRRVRTLPLHRVGFISYEEMVEDPGRGAHWLAHILDPSSFASSFGRLGSQAGPEPSGRSPMVVRALDRYWERAWSDMRRRQIEAGVLDPETER